MSRRFTVGLTVVGALAVLVLWRALSGRGGSERDRPEGAPAELADEPSRSSLVEEATSETPGTATVEEHPAPPGAQRTESMDERPRISGMVRAPRDVLARGPVKVRAEITARTKDAVR